PPRAKRALELALREAIALEHNYIGTEHILLALVHGPDSVAARVLHDAGVDDAALRDAVLTRIGLKTGRSASPPRPRPHTVPWEYRVEELESANQLSADALNAIGAEGWELTATLSSDAQTPLIFKR